MTSLSRLLVLLSFAAAATLLFAPADARAQTCSVTTPPSFGSVTVDIVPNTGASVSGVQVSYNCNSRAAFTSVRLCAYIRATGNQIGPSDYIYYLTKDADSRLGWQLKENWGRFYARDGGGSVSTGGALLYFGNSPGSASGTNINGSNTLTLSFLDRQQQDRVRPGTYTNSYQFVTKYLFNPGNASCEGGLSNPTGTIVTNFTLTAVVPTNCQFENFQDVDFGSWGSVAAAQASSTGVRQFGNVGIRCTYQTPYSITIGDGQNVSGGTRRMRKGTDYLAYALFQPGCNIAWTTVSPLAGTGNTVNLINNHQVCAQLATPLAVAPAAGTYTDLVVVTATF